MSSTQALLAAAVLVALAQSAQAQRQFEELQKRGLPAEQNATYTVARGDVDGDGDLDLVFGDYNQTRFYLNDGTGIFTDATAAAMPAANYGTTCVALGDVDGDGDLDLVFGNSTLSTQSRLCLNNGAGTFTDVTATHMPVDNRGTYCVALGDVDGDGDLDLVSGRGSGHQNRLYLNNGSGTFTDVTATRMPAISTGSGAVALGDVDGDGDLDLVFGAHNRLHLNNGTGTFTDVTATHMPVASYLPSSLALGDVDGDGDLDLVFGNVASVWSSGQNHLYLNNGSGTFTDATAARMPVDNDGTTCVAFGDIDSDGDLDLVFGNGNISTGPGQQNRLYVNDGTGTFTDATAAQMPVDRDWTNAVTMGDVDGDGDLDVVFGTWIDQTRLYLNNGRGTFTDATATRMPCERDWTGPVALGDVDGDGDLDMVLGNGGQQSRLYLNNGSGTFTDATAARMPVASYATGSLALGDVDGDGDLDMVLGNGGQQSCLYLNNGTGTFTDATATRMPVGSYNTSAVALGDVDGDGDRDLVFGDFNQQNRLYLNNGTGTFTDATAAHMPVDNDLTACLALGDVDGDGDLDLVFGNYGDYFGGQQNRLYLNNGSGTFTDATAARMPVDFDYTRAVALGDVDGDGDLDVVFGNGNDSGGQQNRLYLNDGTGTFTDATAARMPIASYRTSCVALGDVDEDGDLDLVFGNFGNVGDLQNRLYLNDGTGTFTDATTARMPVDDDYTMAVALGDVDGHDDLDVVFTNSGSQNRLYVNLLRQLDAPFLLRVGHTYQLDVYARYGPYRLVDVALPFLSTGTAVIPLPPLGTVGIDPNSLIPLPAFVIPASTGVGSVAITVPNVPSLAGISIYGQALLIQYPTQDRLTNVTVDVIWN